MKNYKLNNASFINKTEERVIEAILAQQQNAEFFKLDLQLEEIHPYCSIGEFLKGGFTA